ncbi:MAG: ABC transporter permease [Chitinophagales bacterium]|nr:ABC transporter permease [Chitinophagales bacterium]
MNDVNHQMWTEEISAETSLFSINLKEVWRYKDLLFMFVKRDFVTFYKQTILGPIWFFLQPVLTTITFVIIFGKIAGISTDGVPQIAFYLSGITIWNYFSEVLTNTSNVFVNNASIFGKVYFPRLIMPLSIVVSGLMKFSIQFLLFLSIVFYYAVIDVKIHPNLWILATPLLIVLMAALALGLGMIFSSLTSKYKDLTFLLTFGIQLVMYATPVIYPTSLLSPKLKHFMNFNPLTGIFECFRYGYLGAGNFNPAMLVFSFVIITFILLLGTLIFNKVEKSFMDTV